MTKLKVGFKPGELDVDLPTSGTFDYALRGNVRNPDGTATVTDWPAGTQLLIEFLPLDGSVIASWPATIDGAIATWHIDRTVADPIPARTPCRWVYVNGSTRLPYFTGVVNRHG